MAFSGLSGKADSVCRFIGQYASLLAQLQSNAAVTQEQAAKDIYFLTKGSQSGVDAVIAAGALPLLVRLLRSDHLAVQHLTVGLFKNFAAGSQQNKDAIIAAGALPLLITLLQSDKPSVVQQAAGVTSYLAAGSQQNKDAITAAGALPLLVNWLPSDRPAVLEHALLGSAKPGVLEQVLVRA